MMASRTRLPLVVHLAMATILSASAAQAADWQQVEEDANDKTGWVLYSRTVPDSDFPEYKIIGIIDAPTSIMPKVAYTTLTQPQYVPPKQTRNILEKTKTELLFHTSLEMPAIFSDRDIVVRIKLYDKPGTGVNGYTWHHVKEGPKPKDGIVRMASSRGSWEFAPAGENQTLATHITHTDLAGSIPAWLVRSLAEEFVVNSLNNFRKAAKEIGK